MSKDSTFMTAFHKANITYGIDVGQWPHEVISKLQKLSNTNEKHQHYQHLLSDRPAQFVKTRRTSGTIMLIDYRDPTRILGKYDSASDMADKRGLTMGMIHSYRKNMIWGRSDTEKYKFVAIYQGERCLLSDKYKQDTGGQYAN
ncbi:hypothetical protein [Lentilactobacillus senioris]|uniref:hypothetical protein n=1 Tax=Lentilactobacillus senioris TaxID=931534 RepID=UPI003D2CF17B